MAEKMLFLLFTQAAAGAVLTVLLLVARHVFKKHVRPGLFYAAWLLVALRMLLPAALPNPLLTAPAPQQYFAAENSPAQTDRTQPLADTQLGALVFTPEEGIFTEIDDPSAAKTNAEPSDRTPPLAKMDGGTVSTGGTAANMGGMSASSGTVLKAGPAAILPAPILTTQQWLLVLWGLGVLGTFFYMACANRMLRKMAQLTPFALPDVKSPVYLSELPAPCVLGAFRPVIALTRDSLSPENLRWVLAHENCHIKRCDPQWGILRNVLCALFWFNPFVWLAASLSRRDCELACDEAVNRQLVGDERFDYAQALLRLAGRPLPFAATAMSNTKADLKERLENIVERKSVKRMAVVFAAFLLLAATAASFATTPVKAEQILGPSAQEPYFQVAATEQISSPAEIIETYVNNNTAYNTSFLEQNSVDLLQQKLGDLEKRFGAGHAMKSVFWDRSANYDGEAYWTPFIQALEKVDTREEYLAFLNTRFPGINEAFPGDPSIAQVMPRIDGMIRYTLGIDLTFPRYESCWSSGNFIINGMDTNNNVSYEVETQQNEITSFATTYMYSAQMQYPDAAPAAQAENDGRLARAYDMVKDFASFYLAGRDDDCVVGYKREGDKEDGPVTNPARFDVSFNTGWRYDVEVDLIRMRITRAVLKETGETAPSGQEYLKTAWPMDAINYEDMLLHFDERVGGKQLYLLKGTISAIVESDPQVAVMALGDDEQPMYVTLLNTPGNTWNAGTAYNICAEPIGRYSALPKLFMLPDGSSDYLPLLKAKYTFLDTENYTATKLRDKLIELERSYGGDLGELDAFKSRALAFDESDPYMMAFARALMSVDSLASYQALLNTRFPGINEALPGYTPISQLRKKYNAMLRIGMGADLQKYYSRYEACLGPGEFEIILREWPHKDRYRIHYMNDSVVELATYASPEEVEDQIIVPFAQHPVEDKNKAATVAWDFAATYLYAGDMQSNMSFPDTTLEKGQYPGRRPVQINMAVPGTGIGYIIIVDIETMRVTQVIMSDMDVSDGGTVTPKQD